MSPDGVENFFFFDRSDGMENSVHVVLQINQAVDYQFRLNLIIA